MKVSSFFRGILTLFLSRCAELIFNPCTAYLAKRLHRIVCLEASDAVYLYSCDVIFLLGLIKSGQLCLHLFEVSLELVHLAV